MSVFQRMASKEGVPVEQCLMFHGDETIEPYMTPASAGVTVADIISTYYSVSSFFYKESFTMGFIVPSSSWFVGELS